MKSRSIQPGMKFARLLAIERIPYKKGDHNVAWKFKCDCGADVVTSAHRVLKGRTKSCGCLKAEKMPTIGTIHGHTKNGILSPEYKAWASMLHRTNDDSDRNFKTYKGRGISVCDRWKNDFRAFLEDMGPKPSPEYTLDRIKNELGYFKENCRWSTRLGQARNKRNNRLLTYNGETHPLSEWAEKQGMTTITLWGRLKNGWSLEEALTTPPESRAHVDYKNPKVHQPLTFNGETLPASVWAEKTGIRLATILRRLDIGWSVDKTLSTTPSRGPGRMSDRLITYNGESLPATVWGKRYGILGRVISERVFYGGWPVEKALTTPVRPRRPSLPTPLAA
jgi:hypothetical protein